MLNFASDCLKRKVKSNDGSKNILLKMERDIFGRLLAISLKKQINLEYCLSFPLAPAPPSLFQFSGEMFKTEKAQLANILRSNVKPSTPNRPDIEIVDGFYFLHLLGPSLPQSFDNLSKFILQKLCSTKTKEIHLVFDRYLTTSIKDWERKSRKEIDIPYAIHGQKQIRPNDFYKSLKKLQI